MRSNLSFQRTIALCLILCAPLIFCAYIFRNFPSTEFDEGVYYTTFKSIQRGYPVYSQTYLSQPPGFFLSVYPPYVLFGSTLQAGRLAIFAYSLIGLLAIAWLSWELRGGLASFVAFVAIGALYSIPLYTREILTLHADSLPSTFSALALAALLRYRNMARWRWLMLSSAWAAFAFLTKADVSVLPPIMLAVLLSRITVRQRVKALAIFATVYAATLLGLTVPFGLTDLYTNVVTLRLQLLATTPPDLNVFLTRFAAQPHLILMIIVGITIASIAAYRNRTVRLPLLILSMWILATLLMLAVYRPLLEHHMLLLAVPTALCFAFALVSYLQSYERIGVYLTKTLMPLLPFVIVLFVIVLCVNGMNTVLRSQVEAQPSANANNIIADQAQRDGLDLILKLTKTDDYLITDDGLIAGLSDRLVPPPLVDISGARITSRNLSSEAVRAYIERYKPKLILAWAYRLRYLPHFEDVLREFGYHIVAKLDDDHIAYALDPQP